MMCPHPPTVNLLIVVHVLLPLGWSWFCGLERQNLALFTPPLYVFTRRARSTQHPFMTTTKILSKECAGEVVGANGRLGSFLLNRGNGTLQPVSRDGTPGLNSDKGSPIYVATPAGAIPQVIALTPECRRNDLVLVCNGIFSQIVDTNLEDMTLVVPHFGVLETGAEPVGGSIPTYIYGRHSLAVSELLSPICTVFVPTVKDVNMAAARKLLWASVMWLFTSDVEYFDYGVEASSVTVNLVHRMRQTDVMKLAGELVPIMDILGQCPKFTETPLLRVTTPKLTATTNSSHPPQNTTGWWSSSSTEDVYQYMESYSLSMPSARPSKDLAIKEIFDRNGQFLALDKIYPQPLHKILLRRVLMSSSAASSSSSSPDNSTALMDVTSIIRLLQLDDP